MVISGELKETNSYENHDRKEAEQLENQAFNIYTRTKWASLISNSTGTSAKSKNKNVLKQIKQLWNCCSDLTKQKYIQKARDQNLQIQSENAL